MHQSPCIDFPTCKYGRVVLFQDQMIRCQQAKAQNPLTWCVMMQQRSLLGLFLIESNSTSTESGVRSHFHVSLSGLSIWQFYLNQSLILIRLVACHRTTWGQILSVQWTLPKLGLDQKQPGKWQKLASACIYMSHTVSCCRCWPHLA